MLGYNRKKHDYSKMLLFMLHVNMVYVTLDNILEKNHYYHVLQEIVNQRQHVCLKFTTTQTMFKYINTILFCLFLHLSFLPLMNDI